MRGYFIQKWKWSVSFSRLTFQVHCHHLLDTVQKNPHDMVIKRTSLSWKCVQMSHFKFNIIFFFFKVFFNLLILAFCKSLFVKEHVPFCQAGMLHQRMLHDISTGTKRPLECLRLLIIYSGVVFPCISRDVEITFVENADRNTQTFRTKYMLLSIQSFCKLFFVSWIGACSCRLPQVP